ncbi:sigma-70 family RNA polymerase sigma factor [Nocardia tengchongensis]|uniref:sigma-70 family RNA polymerase sigma factor n=1 Tax=Nocardia tengchongensis TaxID=2055889 RepID=UPI0036A02C0E
MTSAPPDPTAQFVAYRELLFSVVYNILGSVADTEDVLQEVWLAWSARHRGQGGEPVENIRAYLVRAAANQALARRADLSRRRETYVGSWLPEPLVAAEHDTVGAVERFETLSMAMLVVLETLSPVERAVFVLYEVFGFSHPEIADMVNRSPAAVRQLASRARRHVHARRPRHRPGPGIHAQVTERFAAAVLGGDLQPLLEVLAPDVTLWTDGGGKGPATSLRPVHGHRQVAELFVSLTADLPPELAIRYRSVCGEPGTIVLSGASPISVIVLDLHTETNLITGIYSITNPDKLARIQL